VIEEVAEELGWKIQRSMKAGNIWDVLWTDHHIQPDLLIRMQLYQKVSHFPGIHVLSRKNLLGLSFMDMAKRAPEHYDFFPRTWLLPAQYSELRK
jgi:tubulin polyglutamylase TTLL6/13